MSKRQRLSFFHFEGLPDEIILKIFSLLDIKGVLRCGQVSTRLRTICNDQCLWSKLNLSGRQVPYGFIEKAVQNGCEYLNLGFGLVHGGKKAEVPWKLKYLEISKSADEWDEYLVEVPEGLLENCHFLQKLAVDYVKLFGFDIDQICQNGETLRILSLEGCNIEGLPEHCIVKSCEICENGEIDHRTELIQELFTKCHRLTELNIFKGVGDSPILEDNILLDQHICALVDNLTPNILKLNFGDQTCVKDEHVNTLVRRCNKITELDLSGTSITNDSIESMAKHLNSLEKLNIENTNIDFSSIIQVKSISTLKVLRCSSSFSWDKIENLKLQLPHISINEDHLDIASSKNEDVDLDWFWEIRAKQQDLFPKAYQS